MNVVYYNSTSTPPQPKNLASDTAISKELTPLYKEVLAIASETPSLMQDYEFILTKVKSTKHVSRVRLAVDALIELGYLTPATVKQRKAKNLKKVRK